MSYRLIDMYLKDGQSFNIKFTSNIFNLYSKRLEKFNVKYLHFNHYHSEDDPRFRVTIRFDFSDNKSDKKAQEIAGELVKRGIIQNYDIRTDASVLTDIKIAHRFASLCIIELIKHKEFLDELQSKRGLSFLAYLLKRILDRIGYNIFLTWDISRPYQYSKNKQNEIEKLVDACEPFIPKEKEVFKNPDFIERFIHLFLNCGLLQGGNNEENLWKFFIHSNAIRDLSKSYTKQ